MKEETIEEITEKARRKDAIEALSTRTFAVHFLSNGMTSMSTVLQAMMHRVNVPYGIRNGAVEGHSNCSVVDVRQHRVNADFKRERVKTDRMFYFR